MVRLIRFCRHDLYKLLDAVLHKVLRLLRVVRRDANQPEEVRDFLLKLDSRAVLSKVYKTVKLRSCNFVDWLSGQLVEKELNVLGLKVS